MRIGIDGRELLGRPTGVGRYLSELCRQWLRTGTPHELVIYTPTDDDALAELVTTTAHADPPHVRQQLVPGRPGTWWEQTRLPAAANADRLDVFFAPAYALPLRLRVPVVVTMHDLSFSAHPEWFRWREGARRRWLARQAVVRAAAVIAVSAFSRDEILRLFDAPAERIRVIRSGITSRACRLRSTVPANVLYVGSLFNRRHLPTLIRAFAKVHAIMPEARLAIVGEDRTHPPQNLRALAAELGIADHVALHDYVGEAELERLYEEAGVFVFLSEYEGFGLTPLEALSAGVPIVVAATPVSEELYGNAATYVPVADVSETATAILALLTDTRLRVDQSRRARGVLPRFGWDRAARETLAVLEEVAGMER